MNRETAPRSSFSSGGRVLLGATFAAFAIIAVLAPPLPASMPSRNTAGEAIPVDLELVLAVDVSRSMDTDEQKLQRSGYATALRDPAVIAAITGGGWGRIAVTYVEWAGTGLNTIIVPWTMVNSAQSAHAVSRRLEGVTINRMRRTSISGALAHAAALFPDNAYAGLRRVVDVSGDGANNEGLPVTQLRDRLVDDGIIINGLPVMIKQGNPSGYFNVPNLDIYYEDCVIGGTGAFALPVTDPSRFATAIRQKLILEIAGILPQDRAPLGAGRNRPLKVQSHGDASPPSPRIDCFIGEKQWLERQRMWDE